MNKGSRSGEGLDEIAGLEARLQDSEAAPAAAGARRERALRRRICDLCCLAANQHDALKGARAAAAAGDVETVLAICDKALTLETGEPAVSGAAGQALS